MMTREYAKTCIKLNVNELFLSGKPIDSRDDYKDSANYGYIEDNERFYRLAGLIR